MSDEHATVLYKGHRYQRRITKGAPCESCTFKDNSCRCTRPIVQEFEGCGARRYIWVDVDEQGNELKSSTLTDNKGRVTRIEPDVNYTVIFKESGEDGKIIAVQTGMRMPPGAKYICQDDMLHPCGNVVYFDYHKLSDPQKIAYVCTDDYFYDFLKDQLVTDWD